MCKNSEMQILQEVCLAYQGILGTNLVGIYAHGSIAFGCFHWEHSDIDYIVVVNAPLSLDDKLRLMEKTVLINARAPVKGIEMSVVLKECCLNFTYPTPFELHFSNSHLSSYTSSPSRYCTEMQGTDADLAAHFTVIKSKGIVLYGTPVNAVFGPVDRSYYLDSIISDIRDAPQDVLHNPIYVILNLCRVCAYIKEGLILSKLDGGKWALRSTPEKYHELIRSAVGNYELAGSRPICRETALRFSRYMLAAIRNPDKNSDEFSLP